MGTKDTNTKGRVFKTISYLSIGSLVAMLFLFILMVMNIIPFSSGLFALIGVLFVVSLAMSLATPWAKRVSEGRYKILSYVFLGLIAVAMILWIVVVFLLLNLYNKVIDDIDVGDSFISTIKFIQVCVIITIQVIFGSIIATKISNFGKNNIVLQVFTYIGYVILDFYLSYIVSRLAFVDSEIVTKDADLLTSKVGLTVLLFAIVIVGVVEGYNKSRIKRIQKDAVERSLVSELEPVEKKKKAEPAQTETKQEETAEEKLTKLKSLLDKNLITQEEYDKKKEDIISKM